MAGTTAYEDETASSVWPSGVASATIFVPIVPPAPGRLSTTTCCPRSSESLTDRMRAMMSGWPPEVKPVVRRTGRVGNAAAESGADFCAQNAALLATHKTAARGTIVLERISCSGLLRFDSHLACNFTDARD